jgi:hypothetical protein
MIRKDTHHVCPAALQSGATYRVVVDPHVQTRPKGELFDELGSYHEEWG